MSDKEAIFWLIVAALCVACIGWFWGFCYGCARTEQKLNPIIEEQEELIDDIMRTNSELTIDYLELLKEKEERK